MFVDMSCLGCLHCDLLAQGEDEHSDRSCGTGGQGQHTTFMPEPIFGRLVDLAVGQNQWTHFGVGTPPPF